MDSSELVPEEELLEVRGRHFSVYERKPRFVVHATHAEMNASGVLERRPRPIVVAAVDHTHAAEV